MHTTQYAGVALAVLLVTSAASAQAPASLSQAIAGAGLLPLPQPTSAFVAYCQTEPKLCQKYITITDMVATTHVDTSYCVPDSAMSSDAAFNRQIMEIKNWIAAHRELATQETSMSILGAYRAIYPYPKNGTC